MVHLPLHPPSTTSLLHVGHFTRKGLGEWFQQGQTPRFRADQVFEGLYRHRFVFWDAFTALPVALRERLSTEMALAWPMILQSCASQDGSTKHVFQLVDGQRVEAVHMPLEDRVTLCLSSQVGCAMGCAFCATGTMGLIRHLQPEEMVGQVMAMLLHHAHPEEKPINVVLMGMGEPLHNLDNVMVAFDILTDAKGLAIPPRRITLSTAGLVPGIEALGRYAKRPRLALSLNGALPDTRVALMPITRTWSLEALAEALAAFPLEKDEKITLEYVLIQGQTDTPDNARALVKFARRFPSKVNLIPFNGHGHATFRPPTEQAIQAFYQTLASKHVLAKIRYSRGQDVGGACGQLIQRVSQEKAP